MITDLTETTLIAAIEENLFSFLPLFDLWPEAEVHDTPELLWFLTEIPFPLFNSLFRTKLSPDDVDSAIDAAISRCKTNHVPMMWWTGPSAQPTDLGSKLIDRDFQQSDSPGMAADLNVLPENPEYPEDLVIKLVDNDEDLEIWCRVFSEAFGMPDFVGTAFFNFTRSLGYKTQRPYTCYLGSINNEAVAVSSLLLGAGVAGIYNVATLESARRKGIGAAMTIKPLLDARSQGYRVGILHSSEMGYKMYSSLGFQEYCKIFQYIWFDN
ncbi:MAG: GNAT family N-acetyltransferase [Deltaproteobacteria bacterium]|nr:GNAT family N-acetyltransferase [Deltaproteobacteria bacterium]